MDHIFHAQLHNFMENSYMHVHISFKFFNYNTILVFDLILSMNSQNYKLNL